MKFELEENQVQTQGEVFIASTAIVIGQVLLKHQSSVWWGAVLRGDYELITLGERSNVQDNCILHMDEGYPVTIGEGTTVGHKVVLPGCEVGDNSLIGINSVVMNGVVIGNDCLIGSNTLITEDKQIPDGSLVLGSPGKIVRELSEDEIEANRDFAARYVRNSARYRNTLKLQA